MLTNRQNVIIGLTETLRSELALYGIDVQLFQACTMFTPGYENENKTKPAVTLKIEESDDGLTPQQAAISMMKGDVSSSSVMPCSPGRAIQKDGLHDIVRPKILLNVPAEALVLDVRVYRA
jgi:hypothetical protein